MGLLVCLLLYIFMKRFILEAKGVMDGRSVPLHGGVEWMVGPCTVCHDMGVLLHFEPPRRHGALGDMNQPE